MPGGKQVGAAGYTGGEKYFVEKLVGKRITESGRVEYRVKWWGWATSTNTWEGIETLREDCPKLIEEFENAKKRKGGAAKQRENERHNLTPAAAEGKKQGEAAGVVAAVDDDAAGRGEVMQENEKDSGSGDKIGVLGKGQPSKRQAPLEPEGGKMKKAKTNGGILVVPQVPTEVPSMQEKIAIANQSPKKLNSCKPQQPEGRKPKYIPERILGITQDRDTGELQFLIKWKDQGVANLVPALRAHVGCPQLVIQFYEDRLIWRGQEGMQLVPSHLDDELESGAGYSGYFDWNIVE